MRRTCRPAPRRVETQRARRGPGGGVFPLENLKGARSLISTPKRSLSRNGSWITGNLSKWIMLGDPRCMICLGAGRACSLK
jgi:hypothetical protein